MPYLACISQYQLAMGASSNCLCSINGNHACLFTHINTDQRQRKWGGGGTRLATMFCNSCGIGTFNPRIVKEPLYNLQTITTILYVCIPQFERGTVFSGLDWKTTARNLIQQLSVRLWGYNTKMLLARLVSMPSGADWLAF